MKAFLLALVGLALLGCTQVPDSAKGAHTALKNLQTMTVTGVAQVDYSKAYSETKVAVDMFLKSNDAKKQSELAKAMDGALSWYDLGWQVWQSESSELKGVERAGGLGQVVMQHLEIKDYGPLCRDGSTNILDPSRLLPLIWRRADWQVEVVSKLIAGNALADIRKETEEGMERIKGGIGETRKTIDDVRKNLGFPSEKR